MECGGEDKTAANIMFNCNIKIEIYLFTLPSNQKNILYIDKLNVLFHSFWAKITRSQILRNSSQAVISFFGRIYISVLLRHCTRAIFHDGSLVNQYLSILALDYLSNCPAFAMHYFVPLCTFISFNCADYHSKRILQ